MLRSLLLAIAVLALAACSTTSTVQQSHPVAAGTTYAYAFSNQGGDDAAQIAQLDRLIQARLRAAGLIGAGTGQPRIEVTLTHFYLRSNGARFWGGIMAGRDKIVSRVRVLDAAGQQVGSFEVETFNSTAWGTSDGLMERHAEELATRLSAR